MLSPLPSFWTYAFYVMVVWGMSALLVAFRWLTESDRLGAFLRMGAFAWLGLPAVLASTGVLEDFAGRPPQLLRLVVGMVVVLLAFALSPWGRRVAERLPFTLLIGVQFFRFPLEFLLFGLSKYGYLPREMTFAGFNYDVVTGATAGLFWLLLRREALPAWLLWSFNAIGLGTLFVVVTVAVVSLPAPFGWFEPSSEIVAYYPWVWLPTFLVQLAWVSHLLALRKLMLAPSEPAHNF
jgi:hypothetical protein